MAAFSCYLIGSGTLLQECGDILLAQNHKILGVITAAGGLQKWAKQSDLEIIDPSSDYALVLGTTAFDFLLSITHLEKIPDPILRLPRHDAINFHDGPLPRYAGLNAPAWALMNRESHYGVCWHRMTDAIDKGPVLKRENFTVEPDETAVSLNTKCLAAGVRTFTQLVTDLAADAVVEEAQGSAGHSYFGRYRRPPAAALLDWNRPGIELDALVRGLQFGVYPNPLGSPKFFYEDAAFIVTDARPVRTENAAAALPGTIEKTDPYLRVATGDGTALELKALSDLRGHPVNIDQFASRSQLRLTPPPADTVARLTELDAILCRSEAFWTDRLATLTPVAAPLSRSPGSNSGSATYIRRALQLPRELTGQSRPGVVEAALLAVLLARIERQPEFDLALTDAGWSTRIRGLENVVAGEGCCRLRVAPDSTFDALVRAVGAELDQLPIRGAWLHDLFARRSVLQASPASAGTARLPVGIVLGEPPEIWQPVIPRALTLCSRDGAASMLVADARQYSVATLETLAKLVEVMAAGVVEKGRDQPLVGLPALDQETFRRIVFEWNRTEMPYSTSACIHSQIEEQARRTPERTALVFQDAQLSYRALNERANRLAARLVELGVGPDRLVGVHVPRSIDMMVATLAVLKAGGAYVPLDPGFPSERISYMVKDAGVAVILTPKALRPAVGDTDAKVVFIDDATLADSALPAANPSATVTAENLAYVIYTSGSTGRPKGVMVEHGNVLNFFAAMDACIEHDSPGTWLAVTSLSFDISVIELFWTLARGFKVVIQGDMEGYFAPPVDPARLPMGFSLFMWGNDDVPGRDKYRLMLEGAKYFDRNGFEAVWTPERHFHAFGGPYPNPSVTGAALAAVTENIGIRAGSCVSPLHHPIRIAEEWAVVDNLSNGRVALAFASGWQPNDFILRPENHANNKGVMLEQIDTVRRLWRGEKVSFRNPLGQDVATATLPRPVQSELPFWVTTAGNPDTYRQAGELGANILTHLLGQSVEEVAGKIRVYRQARAVAGHNPATGRVTLMLHTFVADNDDEVRELVRQPMKNYLRSSLKLALDFAWSFPAFKRPGGSAEKPQDVDLRGLPDSEIDAILDFAFERYFETSGLFGTPRTCARMIERCKQAGVDEIACLLDFGVQTELVLASLPALNEVRKQANQHALAQAGGEQETSHWTIATQIERHAVTHLQCTPSLARMLLLDLPTRAALGRIRQMLVGGEALPLSLARELGSCTGGPLVNMYGPTETTIWSATCPIASGVEAISLGRPIGNTQIYILDYLGHPLPASVPGELVIGGAGVARGYLHRPELTSERFVPDRFLPKAGARLYRTGDMARFLADGTIEYLGRVDHQVKIRGYRVELEEIERSLDECPDVEHCAVAVHGPSDADPSLVAYVVSARIDGKVDVAELRRHLRGKLPEYMVPGEFVVLDRLPLTPNGKVDRKALPAPGGTKRGVVEYVAPQTPTEKALAELWQELLRVDRVGAVHNFFELGGHSLLAMQVVARSRETLGIELPLRELFAAPTLKPLAARIDALRAQARPELAVDTLALLAKSSRSPQVRAGRRRIEL